MKKINFGICALALTLCATANASTDGKVTFNGKLVAETCSIKEESKNLAVTLPTIAIQRLATVGDQAGSTTFTIKVEKCPKDVSKVAAHFEALNTSGFDSTTGNLINSATASVAGGVQVRLYNPDGSPIRVGSTGKPFDIVNNEASLEYAGGYYAAKQATAGAVTAHVQYVLAYP